MYNPTLGRFMTRDPSGEANGGANLDAYCAANPINRGDPTGLWWGIGWVMIFLEPEAKVFYQILPNLNPNLVENHGRSFLPGMTYSYNATYSANDRCVGL